MQDAMEFPEICKIITYQTGKTFNENNVCNLFSLIDRKLITFLKAERLRLDSKFTVLNYWTKFFPEIVTPVYQLYHNACQRVIVDPRLFRLPLQYDNERDCYNSSDASFLFIHTVSYVLGFSMFNDQYPDFFKEGQDRYYDYEQYYISSGELEWLRRKCYRHDMEKTIKRRHIGDSNLVEFFSKNQPGGYLYSTYHGIQINKEDTLQMRRYLREIKATTHEEIIEQACLIIYKFAMYRILISDFANVFFEDFLIKIFKDPQEAFEKFDLDCSFLKEHGWF